MSDSCQGAGNSNSRPQELDHRSLNSVQIVRAGELESVSATLSASWLEAVETYLDAALDSAETRRAYRRYLTRAAVLFDWRSVDEVSGRDLVEYRRVVISSHWSPSTQAVALAAMRSFLGWIGTLQGHRLPKDVIALALKSPRSTVLRPYTVLTDPELDRFLAAADTPRNLALLALLLGSGLRVTEASNLDIKDLIQDVDGGMLISVRRGKGRKDRIVPIHNEVEEVLSGYLRSTRRYLGDEGPLFLAEDRGAMSRDCARLTARSIGKLVRAVADAAGISAKRVTPHSLRHLYGTRCLRAGGNVMAVSKLLGHASVATTQRYLDHMEVGELRKTVPHLPLGSTT